MTRAESLAMWTRDAARVLQWEGIGTLAPGNHADLIVVDRDPLDVRGRGPAGDARAAHGARRPDDLRRRRAVMTRAAMLRRPA